MDLIINNMDFPQLESLWKATFPDYSIDDYIDTLNYETEVEIMDDVRTLIKDFKKLKPWDDLMMIAFLSILIEFIDSDLPYFYYCDNETKNQIIKNIDLTVSVFDFYKYYDRIFSNAPRDPYTIRRKKNRLIPNDFKEAMNQLKGYVLNRFGILIHIK